MFLHLIFYIKAERGNREAKDKIMNREWSRDEKIAVLKSLCYIIGADRRVVRNEQLLLSGYFNTYGLDAVSAMNAQASMTQIEMSSIIYELSTEDKQLVLNYWQQAVSCDGNIDPQEIAVLAALADECGIDFTRLSFSPNM